MAQPAFQGWADFYRKSEYSKFPQEQRSAGSSGVSFIRAEQAPHELVDPPLPELVLQFCRVLKGPAHYNFGDGWVTNDLGSGSFLVTPPDTEVAYRVPDAHQLLIVAFPKEQVATALQDLGADSNDFFSPLWHRGLVDPTMYALAHRMWAEAAVNEGASALFVDSAALTMLTLLLRACGAPAQAPGNAASERIVSRVRDYVEAHLDDDITLADLASAACLSPYHFARAFKAATGKTPLSFVMERRVERAKALLAANAEPLAQVAYSCGFANQAHFSTVFRKQTGATPGAFRKEHAV